MIFYCIFLKLWYFLLWWCDRIWIPSCSRRKTIQDFLEGTSRYHRSSQPCVLARAWRAMCVEAYVPTLLQLWRHGELGQFRVPREFCGAGRGLSCMHSARCQRSYVHEIIYDIIYLWYHIWFIDFFHMKCIRDFIVWYHSTHFRYETICIWNRIWYHIHMKNINKSYMIGYQESRWKWSKTALILREFGFRLHWAWESNPRGQLR